MNNEHNFQYEIKFIFCVFIERMLFNDDYVQLDNHSWDNTMECLFLVIYTNCSWTISNIYES